MSYTKVNLCQIPELNLSCIGCCGTITGTKEQVMKALKKNTLEFEESKKLPLEKFIKRYDGDALRTCGICHNLIINDEGKMICPAHPILNNNIDIRKNYCDIYYICKSAFVFGMWSYDKKDKFMRFLKFKTKNGMDWYEYSVKMDNGTIIEEFENSKFA